MDLQFVPVLIVGFATSLGLTPVSRQIAMRLGVVDKPNQRKIHLDHKPLMGGLAIVLSFTVSLLLFSPSEYLVKLGAILLATTLLALTGLVDDRYNISVPARLTVMLLAAGIVIAAGVHINLFRIPLIDYPMTVIWIVGITNAVNFLDNMDGLAAGLSAIAAGFFLLIGLHGAMTLVTLLAAALLGSALGFLTYNFNPASTFMGDMGALVLGFVLATLGILVEFGMHTISVSWMIPVLILALPIFDINLVVFTRIAEGRSPGQAGKDHTSHRLMSVGFSQRWTLMLLYSSCLFFGAIGLVMAGSAPLLAWRIGIFGISLLILLYGMMVWIRWRFQRPRHP